MGLGDLLKPTEAARLVALAPSTLSEYRRKGLLIERLHYVRYSAQCYRYYRDALRHWAEHRLEPDEHRKWLEKKVREV
jgi:hypothetical protein